jgi:hypothetical protein
LAVAGSVLAGSTASSSEESDGFRYGLEGNNLVFTSQDEAIQGGSFRLAVKGGQEARIVVELVDIFSQASGSKKSLPLNSSPFTPSGLIEFADEYPRYQPNGEFQYFDIDFSFRKDEVLDRAVLGGLSISIVPEEKSDQQVTVGSSIVATFAYMPTGGIGVDQYFPGLSLSIPKIERVTPDFFPLNMIPDLPFVKNHGDLRVDYELSNSGNIFLETEAELIVQQLNFFSQPEMLRFSNSTAAFLVPGQKTQKTLDIQSIDLEKKNLGVGIYQFTTSVQGQMGEQIETSASNQQTLIIFPWKQSLLGVILLVALRKRIDRAIRGLLSYLQAFREFRSIRNQEVNTEPKPDFQPAPSTLTQVVSLPSENSATFATARRKSFTGWVWQLAGIIPSLRNRFVIPKFSWPATSLMQFPKWKRRDRGLVEPKSPAAKTQVISDVQSFGVQSHQGRLEIEPPGITNRSSPLASGSPSPGTSVKGTQPRPLYPYWYEPTKKSN